MCIIGLAEIICIICIIDRLSRDNVYNRQVLQRFIKITHVIDRLSRDKLDNNYIKQANCKRPVCGHQQGLHYSL